MMVPILEPVKGVKLDLPAKMKAIRAKENLTQEDFCR
jgi:DNA-binding transcriptional regulator YiaG